MLLEEIMSFEDILNQPTQEEDIEAQEYTDKQKQQLEAAEYEKQFYFILNKYYNGIF